MTLTDSRHLLQFVDAFAKRRVVVIGDAILDHYVRGSASRISPEAPVPVLRMESQEWLPGGAANVARNVALLGAEVNFLTRIGQDEEGLRLGELLDNDPRTEATLLADLASPTPLKTRYIAHGQQMLRVDREQPAPLSPTAEKELLKEIDRAIAKCDGVIVSDYGKGLLSGAVLGRVFAAAARRGVEVFVDPKGANYARYRGASVVTPNRKEAQEASGIAIVDEASAARAAATLRRQTKARTICITMSEEGIAVFPQRGRATIIPARAREVFDVTGAGDTLIAVLALARFSGASDIEAAELGNIAAGIVVGRSGVAAPTPLELRREVLGGVGSGARKWLTVDQLLAEREALARAGRRVVFTNGFFDLLNVRHIRLLEQARALGDALVVAINSDASTRRIKGSPRPLLSEGERIELLGALPCVDYLTVFDADTPRALLERLRPDVLAKGDNVGEPVGADIVRAYGGQVRTIDLGFGPTVDEVLERARHG